MIRKEKDENTTRDVAQKILDEVPEYCAFYFFNGVNKYCGSYAKSLIIFHNMLTKIDKESVYFHFKRRDFEKWIRTTIGDDYLAKEISKINEHIEEEELVTNVCDIIKQRIIELKQLLAKEEPYVEHDDDI